VPKNCELAAIWHTFNSSRLIIILGQRVRGSQQPTTDDVSY